MKLGRFMWGILSILAIIFVLDKVFIESDLSLTTSSNDVKINDNTIVYEEDMKVIEKEDNNSLNMVEYINNQPYEVELSKTNIDVICSGSSLKDEELVKNNLVVIASFSKDKKEKSSSVKLKNNEKAYIYIKTSYDSDIKPESEVICDYTVNVLAA